MVVISIVITTIIAFVLVDLLLRMMLTRARAAKTRKERERLLETGLQLDVSDEAPSLKRVELDQPRARILAVDDEPVILDSFRKILVLGGYSVDTVESGPEALGLVRKRDYDFVFTDLKMPVMDGVEVTKSVKHMRPDIDVVVITGYASIGSAVATVKAGALDYIEKPFTEDELLEFVNAALIRRDDRIGRQARHTVRAVRPGTGESNSPFELNVPAGAFVSRQHTWAKLELDGLVLIGPDDMVRKLFGTAHGVLLPEPGMKIEKGDALFSIDFGRFSLAFPSPLTGRVVSVNPEHGEHPEWLSARPFELSWMCGIEPANLAAELPALMIGEEAVAWYQQELERFNRLVGLPGPGTEPDIYDGQVYADRLAEFSKPILADSAV